MPGLFDSLFSDRDSRTTSSTQTGSSSFGLTPQVQDYWQSISGQFGPQNWNPVGADPYQTAAAQSQAGYASGLTPAFGAATGIAQNGISTSDITRFMSPYTQNVVDATRQNFDQQNAIDHTNNQAQAAKLGALSGTNPIVARQLATERQRAAQDPVIAGLYDKGFQTALGAAGQSTQAQLGGVGAASGVAGQQAGINQGQFGMGSQFWNQNWQNQNQPLNWATQGAQTLASLIPGSGQTSSGSSTGTATSTATPSLFSVGTGLLGSAFAGGWRPFGAAKDGGRIEMADGGAVSAQSDPHEKFVKAFDTISGLISRSKGGSVMKPYAGGGEVVENWNTPLPIEANPPAVGQWGTTVKPAAPGFNWAKAGEILQKRPQRPAGDNLGSALSADQASLSNFMSGLRPRFDDGGAVEWGERGPVFPESASGMEPMFSGVGPGAVTRRELSPAREAAAPVAAPAERSLADRFMPHLDEGVWAGQPLTNGQRFGVALMNIQSPRYNAPFAGVAKAIMDLEKDRMEQRRIDHEAARLSGMINGKPTMDMRRLNQESDVALGRINGQPTLARETHELNAKRVPVEIAAQQAQTAVNRAKLEQPELMTPAERAQVANEYGLEAGTPEHDFFVLNGTMPQKTIAGDTIKEVNGKLVRVPAKGAAEMIFDAGPDFSKLPEFAAKSAGFASRMIDAEQNVRGVMGDRGLKASQALNNLPTGTGAEITKQLKAAGFTDEDIASSGLGALLQSKPTFTRDEIAAHLNKNKFDPTSAMTAVANWLPEGAANYFVRTEDQQRYAQAAEQWIRAFLRKESGAAIGKDEFARDFKVYFPQPGDTAETVRQKAQARLNAVRGFTEESRGYFDHAHGDQKALLNEWVTGKTQGRLKPEAEISRPIPRIASDADYEALPSGATFIDPNGNKRVKP